MIFSELYSAYYNAVANIVKVAIDHPLQKNELREIINAHAFGESVLSIEPAISEERWQVLGQDGTTAIKHTPTMPLTEVQKRWLKSVFMDPRVRLFTDSLPDYPDVQPLFTAEDYMVFDRYSDGDNYEDADYREHFRLILDAIRNTYPIEISFENRSGRLTKAIVLPEYLEYSEKDDKFRLIASGEPLGGTYNLGRIRSCKRYEGAFSVKRMRKKAGKKETVVMEIYDRRNALERVLLHFAHFEKEAERNGENTYRVTLCYDADDETEVLIRILSFGPMVKVTGPDAVISLIKERLSKQKSCGL